MDDINEQTLKAQGLSKNNKIKPSHVTHVEQCSVCRKARAEFKGRKVAQCDFCASFGCIECIYKVFPFPQLDKQDKQQNFGVVCMTCETKLHINTVTSDLLRAL